MTLIVELTLMIHKIMYNMKLLFLIDKLRMVFTLSKDYLKKLRSGNSLVILWSGLPLFYC